VSPTSTSKHTAGVRASARAGKEIYVVLAGSGRVKLYDEVAEVERLDATDEKQRPSAPIGSLLLLREKRKRICTEKASPMTFLKGEALS
jgi:hypothetical protein